MDGVSRDMGGKTGVVFLIDKPIFSAIRSTLPGIADSKPPYISGYASSHASLAATTIIQFIDAFLATHTYEYKGDGSDSMELLRPHVNKKKRPAPPLEKPQAKKGISEPPLTRSNALIRHEGKGKKKAAETEDVQEDEEMAELDEDKEMDDAPMVGPGISAVAKPSPMPSSVNFGDVASVPFKAGIYFPYFHDLLVPDIRAVRLMGIDLFFDNLPGENRHAAWKAFRDQLPSLVESNVGGIYTHLLLGCDLALSGQARLYAIFESGVYHGFCLLGDFFTVYQNSVAHSPISAEELRKELEKIQSVSKTKADIVQLLKEMKIEDVELDISKDDFSTRLAGHLSKVDEKSVELAVEIKRMAELLGNYVSTFRYERLSPSSAIETMSLILGDPSSEALAGKPFDFYIPPKNWKVMADPRYRFLARHGPTSFSLRNAKGDEYSLNPLTKHFDLVQKPKKGDDPIPGPRPKQNHIYCYEKPVGQCTADWKLVFERGSIKQDGKERAAPQRSIVIQKDVDIQKVLALLSNNQALFPVQKDEVKEIPVMLLATEGAGVTVGETGEVEVAFDF